MNNQTTEVNFNQEWLEQEKYQMKLLALVACLAKENRAYRGTLNDYCAWLGISNDSKNKRAIRIAIEKLREEKLAYYIEEGRDITLTLGNSRHKDVRKVQSLFIELIKDKSSGVAWENVLRVYVWLLYNSNRDIIKNGDIAEALNMNVRMVKRTKAILIELNLIKTQNRASVKDGKFTKLGQSIVCCAWID